MKKRTKTRLATLESKIRWLQYIIEFNNLKEPEMPDIVSGVAPAETPFMACTEARSGRVSADDWPKPAEPPAEVQQVVEQAGGTISGAARLPDGSGFCTASFPLPKDHWIYEKHVAGFQPPMPKELKFHPSYRGSVEPSLRAALKTAIRGATNGGKEMDFDPDALVMNFFAALFNPED